MRGRGSVWLAMACAPALGACSLLLGEGFTGADAIANDGGATDSPNGDGPVVPGTDGSSGSDGSLPGSDAGEGGDGGGNGGCPAATVSFCDDFQRASKSDVKGSWDVIDVNASGSLTLSAEPGNTNDLYLASSISAMGGQAQLSKAFTQQPTKFHFELSLTVNAFSSQNATYVAGIAMPNGGASPSLVYLYVETNALWLVQQITDGANYWRDAVPVSSQTKHRISIDLTFNGKLLVKVDGVTKLDQNAQTFLVPKPPSVYLGASSIDGIGDDGSFSFDDFVFTID